LGLLLLTPGLLFANSATVDCTGATPGAFTSIQAAVSSLPKQGPNDITVLSNCTEHVLISNYNDLSIFATPGSFTVTSDNAARRVINITDSTKIVIDGLSFAGGRGLFVNNSQDVFVGDGNITNSGAQGMVSVNSVVDIFNMAIQHSTRSGIVAQGGSFSVDGNVTVTNNGRAGISMTNGHLTLNGGDGTAANPNNVISNNGFAGVAIADAAEADIFGGNNIDGNGTTGLQVIHTSTVIMSGSVGTSAPAATINNNQGVGVHIGETSHGEFDTLIVSGNGSNLTGGLESGSGSAGGMEVVENSDMFIDGAVDVSHNHANGVFVDESSVLSSLGGNTITHNQGNGFLVTTLAVAHFFAADTVNSNTGEPLECDSSSVVVGKAPGHEKCANVKLK
jgi:hypothetical protein